MSNKETDIQHRVEGDTWETEGTTVMQCLWPTPTLIRACI